MNRDEQEMALWAAEYSASRLLCAADRAAAADAAAAFFAKRYPAQPAAPKAVWWDTSPHVNRNQQEMALWRRVFERWYSREEYTVAECGGIADAAVAEFRKRYPAEPTAPEAVWYDEPPFEKIDKTNYCWVQDIDSPQAVYWSNLQGEWRFFEGLSDTRPLNGRRVYPITKPQEPTT